MPCWIASLFIWCRYNASKMQGMGQNDNKRSAQHANEMVYPLVDRVARCSRESWVMSREWARLSRCGLSSFLQKGFRPTHHKKMEWVNQSAHILASSSLSTSSRPNKTASSISSSLNFQSLKRIDRAVCAEATNFSTFTLQTLPQILPTASFLQFDRRSNPFPKEPWPPRVPKLRKISLGDPY